MSALSEDESAPVTRRVTSWLWSTKVSGAAIIFTSLILIFPVCRVSENHAISIHTPAPVPDVRIGKYFYFYILYFQIHQVNYLNNSGKLAVCPLSPHPRQRQTRHSWLARSPSTILKNPKIDLTLNMSITFFHIHVEKPGVGLSVDAIIKKLILLPGRQHRLSN